MHFLPVSRIDDENCDPVVLAQLFVVAPLGTAWMVFAFSICASLRSAFDLISAYLSPRLSTFTLERKCVSPYPLKIRLDPIDCSDRLNALV
jgi:hypothetical protein